LNDKLPLTEVIERVKKHLNLSTLRLAIPATYNSKEDITIGSIAVCVGSGASVLKGVKADLFLTGEMSHHDILAAIANGTTVLLTEHTNCERGT
jgi:putative NIF3 family GTP cyclohydrolase 1 type 2